MTSIFFQCVVYNAVKYMSCICGYSLRGCSDETDEWKMKFMSIGINENIQMSRHEEESEVE